MSADERIVSQLRKLWSRTDNILLQNSRLRALVITQSSRPQGFSKTLGVWNSAALLSERDVEKKTARDIRVARVAIKSARRGAKSLEKVLDAQTF
jgi:hypothetical protein